MKVLGDRPTVFVDVDETLVTWARPPGEFVSAVVIPTHSGEVMTVWPHWAHIQRLQDHYRLGHQVVVWSHGGATWAAQVVEALSLAPYVHVVCCKGSWFYDDKPDEIITEYTVRYIQPGSPA